MAMQLIAQPVYLGLEPVPVPLPGHDVQHRGLVLDHYRRKLGGITEHDSSNSLSVQAVTLVLIAGAPSALSGKPRVCLVDRLHGRQQVLG